MKGALNYFLKIFINLVALGVSCGMWGLVPRLEIEPGSPALGAQSLSHCTTIEVPDLLIE